MFFAFPIESLQQLVNFFPETDCKMISLLWIIIRVQNISDKEMMNSIILSIFILCNHLIDVIIEEG